MSGNRSANEIQAKAADGKGRRDALGKVFEPHSRPVPSASLVSLLQLLPGSQDIARHPCNGIGPYLSSVDSGGTNKRLMRTVAFALRLMR
jgi:hypothetical protein